MVVLNDADIKKALLKKDIIIEGLDPTSVEVASVDLTLGREFQVFKNIHIR